MARVAWARPGSWQTQGSILASRRQARCEGLTTAVMEGPVQPMLLRGQLVKRCEHLALCYEALLAARRTADGLATNRHLLENTARIQKPSTVLLARPYAGCRLPFSASCPTSSDAPFHPSAPYPTPPLCSISYASLLHPLHHLHTLVSLPIKTLPSLSIRNIYHRCILPEEMGVYMVLTLKWNELCGVRSL